MSWPLIVSTLSVQGTSLGLDDFETLCSVKGGKPWQGKLNALQSAPLKTFLVKNPNWWREGEKILKDLKSMGAQALCPWSRDYPPSFLWMERPPIFLSYLGRPCWKSFPMLSVVGSRDPQSSSLQWMECHLAPLIEQQQLVTVSGGARGIDQKAHTLSLSCGQPTIAFLPSGLQRIYPPNLERWIHPLLDAGGALITEYHPFCEIRKHHFRSRNRLIAGLSKLVLVVEGRRRSGSLMTAYIAMEGGHSVAVIPGHPTQQAFQGTNDLLFSGASMVRDQTDLLSLLASENPVFALRAQESQKKQLDVGAAERQNSKSIKNEKN